jgi:hypothetical protein
MNRFCTALVFLVSLAALAPAAWGAPPAARRASRVAESFAPTASHRAAGRARTSAARRLGVRAAHRSRVPVRRTGRGHVGRIPSARTYYLYYRSSPNEGWTVYGGYRSRSDVQKAVQVFRSRGYDALAR